MKLFSINCRERGMLGVMAETRAHAIAKAVHHFCDPSVATDQLFRGNPAFNPDEVLRWMVNEKEVAK